MPIPSPITLNGKVALVTGGTKGIGRAIALRLASAGAKLVLNYRSDASAAFSLVATIGNDRALAVQADAGSLPDLDRLVAAAVERFGRIDVLVPNAGLMPMRTVEDTTEADFDAAFRLNVKGPYFLVQKALPHIPAGGRVILISTGVTRASAIAPPYLLYAATKGVIEQMTRLLSKGLASKRITVNAVAPGPTATELFYEGKSEALVESIMAASPFQRIGEPDDIAGVVAFLAGEESRWLVGQTVGVNGATFV